VFIRTGNEGGGGGGSPKGSLRAQNQSFSGKNPNTKEVKPREKVSLIISDGKDTREELVEKIPDIAPISRGASVGDERHHRRKAKSAQSQGGKKNCASKGNSEN